MKQILQGVEHMHKKRIVHLDLKVGDSSWLLRVTKLWAGQGQGQGQ